MKISDAIMIFLCSQNVKILPRRTFGRVANSAGVVGRPTYLKSRVQLQISPLVIGAWDRKMFFTLSLHL